MQLDARLRIQRPAAIRLCFLSFVYSAELEEQ